MLIVGGIIIVLGSGLLFGGLMLLIGLALETAKAIKRA
jgi:hypothetical protein